MARGAARKQVKAKRSRKGTTPRAKAQRIRTRSSEGPRSGKRAPSFSSDLKRREGSIDDLGERVKRGPIPLARTAKLTPTGSGWRALGRAVLGVQRAQGSKRLKTPRLYSYTIEVEWTAPNGERKRDTVERAGFPITAAVESWRKRHPLGQKGKAKRRQSKEAAFRDLVEAQVIGAINRKIDTPAEIQRYLELMAAIQLLGPDAAKGRKRFMKDAAAGVEPAKVRAKLRAFKEQRNLKFRVTFNREV